MRSLESARTSWETLKQYESVDHLKRAVRLEGANSIATAGSRSACWKIFLLFENTNTSTWTRTLSSSRSAYDSLRTHFLRHIDNPDELAAAYDPLSEDAEPSPWQQLRRDEELRGEILQDVVRCMPENLYFRQPDTQRMLLDILFIFCKLNPDLSYRQGMHEILAPILWVVERDAIDLGENSRALGEDSLIKATFDAEYIEHDAFAIFGQVMQSAKNFYEQTTTSGRENPMVARSRRIFNEMLPLVDKTLASHLENIDIVPQIFLMRWIRLLFGREFAFDDVLTIWDVIFAEDATLEIVDHMALAMLLRLHWDLIDSDYNTALTLLLKYPEITGSSMRAQTLALDALYLRDHMDQRCGSHLVSKYTGRPLQEDGRPVTPPALQRNITTFSGANTVQAIAAKNLSSAARASLQPRNLEAVLQSTAKTIYARGESLGIGKAVRSAVDEVHKRAQEIRDHQTPSPPVTRRPRSSRSAFGPDALQRRLTTLQARSEQLSKLLEGAVAELWDFHRAVTDSNESSQEATNLDQMEKLSVAIAKVQFVQVYLDDPELPLPADPDSKEPNADAQQPSSSVCTSGGAQKEARNMTFEKQSQLEKSSDTENQPEQPSVPFSLGEDSGEHLDGLADPSTFEDIDPSQPEARESAKDVTSRSTLVSTPVLPPDRQTSLEQSLARPRLQQSSLLWMLGQDNKGSESVSKPSYTSQDHGRNRAFLFGDEIADSSSGNADKSARRNSGKKLNNVTPQDGDDGFDLGSLRHGKRKNA